MNKIKGVSLIELVVSMGIFAIVSTLAIGAFVVVARIRTLTGEMREAQQKTRVAMEIITRSARQAEKVIITDSGKTLTLYFQIKTTPTAKRFEITTTTNGIKYYENCDSAINISNITCPAFSTFNDLLGGEYVLFDKVSDDNKFTKKAGILYPTLDIDLNGRIEGIYNNLYFGNEMKIKTTIPLESVR